MPANVPHRETVHAEPVFLAIVATEAFLRNAIAFVTAALLPVAMLRLPTMGTITLPSSPLLPCLSRAAFSCGPVVLLLTLLSLLILLSSGLLLLSRRVVALLTLLLILLPLGLLLILFRGVLLLTLLSLLILLPVRLLLR